MVGPNLEAALAHSPLAAPASPAQEGQRLDSEPSASSTAAKRAKPNPREAALAAAQARLGGGASPIAPSTSASSSSAPTMKVSGSAMPPLFGSGSATSSSAPKKWAPTEKEQRECEIKFARLLDRGLVRDNGYRQVAEGVETLILIAKNVIEHDDPKYRKLKASNSLLKNKVLNLKGGHEFLIALGFRITTIEFTQFYIYNPTLKSSFELETGTQVLSEHLSGLQSRAANAALSATAHKEAEAARVAQALAQIEADREGVQLRLRRDNVMREREERLKREEKERLEKEEEEAERLREEAERMGTGGAAGLPGGNLMIPGPAAAAGLDDEDDDMGGDEDEEDEDEDSEEEVAQPTWTGGRKLGE